MDYFKSIPNPTESDTLLNIPVENYIQYEQQSKNNTQRIYLGNYTLIVNIIEIRDIKAKLGDLKTCNPYVEIKIAPFDLKQTTKLKTSTFNARYNEIFNFDFNISDIKEILVSRILISVYNYGKIYTSLIGSFPFSMEEIYNKPGHEIFREWVALSDPNDIDSVGIRGYLKTSITILGPNDKLIGHSLEEIESEDHNAERDDEGWEVIKNVKYSKAMKLKTWGIKTYLYRAENLPATESVSLYKKNVCDPYVTMQFGDTNDIGPGAKSSVVPQTQNPIWDAGSYIYLRTMLPEFANTESLPSSSQQVQININDEHLGDVKDSRLATCFIPFMSLMQDRMNLLLADRALSAFFHPRSAEKKKALLMERLKLTQLKSDNMADQLVVAVGMELRKRDSRELYTIIRVDESDKIIYAIPHLENGAPQISGKASDTVQISKRDYKDWWLLPPLIFAKPVWLNLYGAPEKDEGDKNVRKLMNEGRKEGSSYLGRICLSIHLFESESIETAEQRGSQTTSGGGQINDGQYFELKHAMELLPSIKSVPEVINYRLILKPLEGSMLYCASSLMDGYLSNEEVAVVTQCGPYTWRSKLAAIKNGTAEWSDSFLDVVMSFPSDTSQIPDLFVYLERTTGSRKGKKISYLRFNMNDFFIALRAKQVTKKQPRWYPLHEDPILKLVPFGEFPGQLLLASAFGPADDKGWNNISKDVVSLAPVNKCSYYFWMHLFQGQNLADLNSTGGNLRAFVSLGNKDGVSEVKKSTIHPVWNQSIGFRVDNYPEPNSLDRGAPIFVSIIDKSKNVNRSIGHFWYSPQKAFENGLDFIQTSHFAAEQINVLNDEGLYDASLTATFQLFKINDGIIMNPNPDPEAFILEKDEAASKLHSKLVPSELHPQNFTVAIELLGLRNMILNLPALLGIKDPKVSFEVGGIKTVFSQAPSYVSNGNYVFGEDSLPIITIDSKLLYCNWMVPTMNVEVRHGVFDSLVGRGTIKLGPNFIGEDNLDEINETLSVNSTMTKTSVVSLTALDQDLTGFEDDIDSAPNSARMDTSNRPVSLTDAKQIKVETNFFGSRTSQKQLIEEKGDDSDSEPLLSRIGIRPVSAAYKPLHERNANEESAGYSMSLIETRPKNISSDNISSSSVTSKKYIPLSSRNDNFVKIDIDAVNAKNKKLNESEIEVELTKTNKSKSVNFGTDAPADNQKVKFQDIKFDSDEKDDSDNSEDELITKKPPVEAPAVTSKKLVEITEDDDSLDSRWYMRSREQMDSELEEGVIWTLIEPILQTRSPNNWADKISILVEVLYQNWFTRIRQLGKSFLNKLDPSISSLLLHSKGQLIMSPIGNGDFSFDGSFMCTIKSVDSCSSIKELESYLKNQKLNEPLNFTGMTHQDEVELRVIVETQVLADNGGYCLITKCCTFCGEDETSQCRCTSSYLMAIKSRKPETFSVIVKFAKEVNNSPPLVKAFCHHPICWLQKKAVAKMNSSQTIKAPFIIPNNFFALRLNMGRKNLLVSPFQTCNLYRGKGKSSTAVGALKCRVKVIKGWQRFDTLKRKENTMNDVPKRETFKVRVYILRGINLTPSANTKTTNPYLVVSLGKEILNTKNLSDKPNYGDRTTHNESYWGIMENTVNPDFSKYGCFEFTALIPGESKLNITVQNSAVYGLDNEIGQTTIDLEERIICPNFWRRYPPVVERRTLSQANNSRFLSRGKLEMWLEMIPLSNIMAIPYPMIDIVPPPPSNWELRVIIYEVDGIPASSDDSSEMNDLYVRTQIEGGEWKETDIHLRARDGRGSFNWRLKFPVQLPLPDGLTDRLKIQVWDKDLILTDDAIAEAYLDMKPAFKKAMQFQRRVVLFNDWKVKQVENMEWLSLAHPNVEGPQGKVRFSAELLPIRISESLQNGIGQSAPNKYPFLPPPDGRPEWDWTKPHLMLLNIIGPDMFAKIKRYIIIPLVGIPLFVMLGYLLALLFTNFGV